MEKHGMQSHPHHMHPMHPHHHHSHHHHAHMHPHQAPVHSHPSKDEMYKKCRDHMHRYVLVHTRNGRSYDGFVEQVDEENLFLAVFVDINDRMGRDEPQMGANPQGGDFAGERQVWGYPGFGYGYPGGYGFPGYGYYGYGRPRRFRRLVLPLAALTALSLLPYY